MKPCEHNAWVHTMFGTFCLKCGSPPPHLTAGPTPRDEVDAFLMTFDWGRPHAPKDQ